MLGEVLGAVKGKGGTLRVIEYFSLLPTIPEEAGEVIQAFREEGSS